MNCAMVTGAIEPGTHTHTHLHHGPPPAVRVQDVDVVKPLLVLGAAEHEDASRDGVVDGGVAGPALEGGAGRQRLRRQPRHIL